MVGSRCVCPRGLTPDGFESVATAPINLSTSPPNFSKLSRFEHPIHLPPHFAAGMKCLKVDDLLLSLHEAAVWRGSDVAEGSTGTGHQRAGAGGHGCTGAVHHLLQMRATFGWKMNHFTYIFTYYIYNYIYHNISITIIVIIIYGDRSKGPCKEL